MTLELNSKVNRVIDLLPCQNGIQYLVQYYSIDFIDDL